MMEGLKGVVDALLCCDATLKGVLPAKPTHVTMLWRCPSTRWLSEDSE